MNSWASRSVDENKASGAILKPIVNTVPPRSAQIYRREPLGDTFHPALRNILQHERLENRKGRKLIILI
jgi:hypothetical protein